MMKKQNDTQPVSIRLSEEEAKRIPYIFPPGRRPCVWFKNQEAADRFKKMYGIERE